MPSSIPERDWRVFRELHTIALNRLCERVLNQVRKTVDKPAGSPHETYLKLYKLIENRDEDIAHAFNDFRRSTAVRQLAIIYSMGLIAEDELGRFTDETVKSVRNLSEIFGR